MTESNLFSLSSSDGTTDSERLLSKLCRQSFLSLWTYSNIYTDEGGKLGKGSGKEFADVLLIFGNEIAIFSDKHIEFDRSIDIRVAWNRWYRRAVHRSVNQLHGAESWARRFPNRLFLDPKCQKRLPLSIENIAAAKIHLIAVTRGSFDACREYFDGSVGSHIVATDTAEAAIADAPFVIGRVGVPKRFVHVFDEFSLELALRELDTARDFLDYISEREALLSYPGWDVMAEGEEQMISFYLTNTRDGRHTLLPAAPRPQEGGILAFDGSHFEGLMKNEAYQRKKHADQVSYLWDELIEKFVRLGMLNPTETGAEQTPEHAEVALRVMAAESRFRRRSLSEALSEFNGQMLKGKPARGARIVRSPSDPLLIYVFLVLPKGDESYDEYRSYRAAVAHAYCLACRVKFLDSWRVVCIAFDHPQKTYQGGSEDLVMIEAKEVTEDMVARAEVARTELNILRDTLKEIPKFADEFPKPQETQDEISPRTPRANKSRKVKARRKMASASRKRNRK